MSTPDNEPTPEPAKNDAGEPDSAEPTTAPGDKDPPPDDASDPPKTKAARPTPDLEEARKAWEAEHAAALEKARAEAAEKARAEERARIEDERRKAEMTELERLAAEKEEAEKAAAEARELASKADERASALARETEASKAEMTERLEFLRAMSGQGISLARDDGGVIDPALENLAFVEAKRMAGEGKSPAEVLAELRKVKPWMFASEPTAPAPSTNTGSSGPPARRVDPSAPSGKKRIFDMTDAEFRAIRPKLGIV